MSDEEIKNELEYLRGEVSHREWLMSDLNAEIEELERKIDELEEFRRRTEWRVI